MGKKNPQVDMDHHEDFLASDDFDIDTFEQEHYEKNSRGRGSRKARRRQAARNRFSDYEEERWLKRQASDWEDYDSFHDDDEPRFSFTTQD